jgi:cyclopropane fatty-acyl-phospholipid synthase-like methyltransferase
MQMQTEIDYSRHYLNWHSDSPEHMEKMRLFYEKRMLPYFPPDRNVKILDIGCGMGFLLNALKGAGYINISGIDVDEHQVMSCRKKGLDVTRTSDTAGFLEEHAGEFDVITAFDVLEHIPPDHQIAFVRSVSTALKTKGVFMATVPNATSALASRNRYIDYTHHVLFTEVSLDFVLYNGGFRNIGIRPMEYVIYSFSLKSIIHRLMLGFFRGWRRMEMIAELGTTWGKRVPLTFNLLAIAMKD